MPPPVEPAPMKLLLPEWQGFGLHADVAAGAEKLSELLFDGQPDVRIDAPAAEPLHVIDGVLGLSTIAARLRITADELHRRAPDRITMIGGTCAVELGPVSYLNERHGGDLAVLWLDAHADLNTPSSSPSAHLHGMALRALMGEGHASLTGSIRRPLRAEQVALIGARDLDPPEAEFVITQRIRMFGDAVFADPRPVMDWLKPWKHVYLHFDVDVLNPNGFTNSLMTAPGGGPSLDQAVAFISAVQSAADVVGFSVVEFCDRDPATTASFVRAIRRHFAPNSLPQ
jgi:arginase